MLAAYSADPELKSLLGGMATADRKSQVFYGENIPRAKLLRFSVQQGVAVIDDCQDSSRAGLADRKTGKRLTIGVKRNHVVATLHLVDGTWRVVFISYSRTKC